MDLIFRPERPTLRNRNCEANRFLAAPSWPLISATGCANGQDQAHENCCGRRDAREKEYELSEHHRARFSREGHAARVDGYSCFSRWEAFTRSWMTGRICLSKQCRRTGDTRHCSWPPQLDLRSGSDAGGHRAAAVYSLVETCKLNNVDPQAWLADVLARLPDYPANKIADLLPWNWQAARLAIAA